MKKICMVVAAVILAGVCLAAPGSGYAAAKNSVNIGAGGLVGPDLTASLFFAEYERLIAGKMALFVRGGQVHYSYDDGTYVEDGDPKGFDVGVRAYLTGHGAMKGFYIGGALGSWQTDWTFTDDKGTSYESQGKGDSSAVRADLEVGARLPLGSERVSLMPAFHLGHFFSSSSSCEYTSPSYLVGTPCDKDTQVGFYGFLSVAVGIAF